MRNQFKKLVSLLLVVSLAVPSTLIGVRVMARSSGKAFNEQNIITPEDMGIADGTYVYTNDKYWLAAESAVEGGFDGKVFSADVTFSSGESCIRIGGKDSSYFGLNFTTNYAPGYLCLMAPNGEFNSAQLDAFRPEKIGFNPIGTEFNLKVSIDYIDHDSDGNKDDVKVGVFFNDQLYDEQYIYLVDSAPKLGNHFGIVVGSDTSTCSLKIATPKGAEDEVEQITVADFEGCPKDGQVWSAGANADTNDFTSAKSLLNREFAAKVKFSGNAKAQLHVGAKGPFFGIILKSDPTQIGAGNLCLMGGDIELGLQQIILTPEKAGVALVDNEFELRLRVMAVDHDNDGAEDDIAVSVYINGNLYDNTVIYANNTANMIQNHLFMWLDPNASLSLKPVDGEENPPVEFPEDEFLGEITPNDFTGYPTGGQTWQAGANADMKDFTSENSLLNREFAAKVQFPGNAKAQLHVGAKGPFFGIILKSDPTGIGAGNLCLMGGDIELGLQQIILTPEKAGVALVDNEFELRIRVMAVDHDNDGAKDDIAVRLYIDGTLYDNTVIYADNTANMIQNHLFMWLDPNASLLLKPVDGEDNPPEEIPEDEFLGEITPNDFTDYPTDGEIWEAGANADMKDFISANSLLNREFVAKVQFSGNAKAQLHVGARQTLGGIILKSDPAQIGEGNLCLRDLEGELGGQQIILTPEKAGIALVDNEFELRIRVMAADRDGDGTKDDIAVRLYINGTLYDNTVIYADNAASLIGTHMSMWLDPGASLFLKASGQEQDGPIEKKPNNFREITFSDFAIPSGQYGYNNGALAMHGVASGDMNRVFFSGDVKFEASSGLSMIYGGMNDNPWYGLYFTPTDTGRIHIYDPELKINVNLNERTAGTKLVGETFRLGISTEYVDWDGDGAKNDVKFGVWINDKLYNNKYFYIKDYIQSMGSALAFYGRDNGYFIHIEDTYETPEPGPAISPDKDLVRISFTSFNVKDDSYNGKNPESLAAFGSLNIFHPNKGMVQKLDGTLFEANVKFPSTSGAEFRIGGKDMGWYGLRVSSGGENLYLEDAEGKTKRYVFKSKVAGVRLTENMINLKMSFQVMDADGDGAKDDVRLGVWFNDVLYCNRYIDLKDYAKNLGNMIGIYSSREDSVLKIRSVDCRIPLDFSIWGFTNNWKKELGITR